MPALTPQTMRPHGLAGHIAGWLMDHHNRDAHRAVLVRLSVAPADAIIEIGFGAGQLVQMLARQAPHGYIAGVDPSELMVKTALRRNARAVDEARVDLKVGTADAIAWPDEHFGKAAALHCFQFWGEPAKGLAEVRRVLRPGGVFVLVLRDHKGRAPDWLPNPLSRETDEIAATAQALEAAGFEVLERDSHAGKSPMIVSRRV